MNQPLLTRAERDAELIEMLAYSEALLLERNRELEARNAELEARNAELAARNIDLESDRDSYERLTCDLVAVGSQTTRQLKQPRKRIRQILPKHEHDASLRFCPQSTDPAKNESRAPVRDVRGFGLHRPERRRLNDAKQRKPCQT